MSKAIVIPSHKRFRQWLNNLLPTIDTEYTIIIHTNTDENNSYEIGAINKALELGVDEFFILHDTTEIKDNNLFRVLFNEYKGHSVFMNTRGQMFLNKYRSEVLKQIVIPTVVDKKSAVNAETILHANYLKVEQPVILDPTFVDGDLREEKFGRINMVIENKWIKKYKGTWNAEMIESVK